MWGKRYEVGSRFWGFGKGGDTIHGAGRPIINWIYQIQFSKSSKSLSKNVSHILVTQLADDNY